MRHHWTLKTKAGNDKCERCGLIRETWGAGKRTNYQYYRGNKPVGLGLLMNKAPECETQE